MLFRQGFLFKLKPNGRQARLMSRFAGCCRFVYNKGLSWAKEQYENKNGKHPSYKNLSALLPEWKKHPEMLWLSECYSQCLQQSMKDLSRAYRNFFSGRTAFPVFHRKYGANDAFRYPQRFKIDETGKQIYLPGIGFVKYRRSRYIEGKAKNITVILRLTVGMFLFKRNTKKKFPYTKAMKLGWIWGWCGFARSRTEHRFRLATR